MSGRPSTPGDSPRTLDQVLMQVVADARNRGPGRYPCCPVCTQPMAVEVEVDLLRCTACHTSFGDPVVAAQRLQLVA